MRNKRKRNRDKPKNKVQAERQHFKRRAEERLGLTLVRKDLNEIAHLIHNRFATFVRQQSHRVSHYLVPWEGDVLGVVFDHLRNSPVTFLTVRQMLDAGVHGPLTITFNPRWWHQSALRGTKFTTLIIDEIDFLA